MGGLSTHIGKVEAVWLRSLYSISDHGARAFNVE